MNTPKTAQKAATHTPADIDTLVAKRFTSGGTPRSQQYEAGYRAGLTHRLLKESAKLCGFTPGTVEFDAYHSGFEHGLDRATLELRNIEEAAQVAA